MATAKKPQKTKNKAEFLLWYTVIKQTSALSWWIVCTSMGDDEKKNKP